jgi:phosphoglycolate phosphatase
MNNFPNLGKEDIAIIGDRKYDIEAGKQVGVDTIGVLYGFGTKEELQFSNPRYIVSKVSDLKSVLFSNTRI